MGNTMRGYRLQVPSAGVEVADVEDPWDGPTDPGGRPAWIDALALAETARAIAPDTARGAAAPASPGDIAAAPDRDVGQRGGSDPAPAEEGFGELAAGFFARGEELAARAAAGDEEYEPDAPRVGLRLGGWTLTLRGAVIALGSVVATGALGALMVMAFSH